MALVSLAVLIGTASPRAGLASPLQATAPTLGTASSFAVLAGSTVTNTGPTVVNGDLGVSPGTAITGFPPGIVNGTQHAGDATAAKAETDASTAYGVLAGQACDFNLTGQDLGGKTLVSGVYCFSSSAQLTGTLVLSGTGTYVFKIGSTLTTASSAVVSSSSCNVFWQVGSSATLGTGTTFAGSIIANTSVTLNTGASVTGGTYALNGAVTLGSNTVSAPSCAPGPSPTPTSTDTPTSTPTTGPTGTPTATITATTIPSATGTPTSTPTNTLVPTDTPVGTGVAGSPTSTPTDTPTLMPTSTSTSTATATNTVAPTATLVPNTGTIHKCVTSVVVPTCSAYGNVISVGNNQQVTYVVTLANTGSTTASFTGTDVLAPGQTFISCAPTPGCGYVVGPSGTAGSLTFVTGPIAPQASVSFYVTVRIGTGPVTILNTARIPLGPPSETTTIHVSGPGQSLGTPVIPIITVNTPVATPTSSPTATSTFVAATNTPVVATSTPTFTATATSTSTVTSTATATSTATVSATPTATAVLTNTPVAAVSTSTRTATKRATATGTVTPIVYGYFTHGHSSTTTGNRHGTRPRNRTPRLTRVPGTGFGGTNHALALDAAIGRTYRSARGNVTLGVTPPLSPVGGPNPFAPVIPIVLAATLLGLAVLTRKVAYAKR